MSTSTQLDFKKTIQAATLLAQRELGGIISRMRLLKLLYIADREALKEIGRTISGDRHAALRKGPILSEFYDIIKGETVRSKVFEKSFKSVGYKLNLIKSAGVGHLNRYEIRKLQEISERYAGQDDEDLSEITHAFSEWKKNKPAGNSSRAISLSDMLEGVGKKDHEAAAKKRAILNHAINELWS